jgi:hypothetical protein
MRWRQITCNTVKCPISSTLSLWWWQGFLPHYIFVLFCLKRDLRGFLSCVLLPVTEFAHSLLLIPICTAVRTVPAWLCPFPTRMSSTVSVRVSSSRTPPSLLSNWNPELISYGHYHWFPLGYQETVHDWPHRRPSVFRRDLSFISPMWTSKLRYILICIYVYLFVQWTFRHLR